MSVKRDFMWLAEQYTLMFIFGATHQEQLDLFEERDQYFDLRTDHPDDVVEAHLRHYGFDPDEHINLMAFHRVVFKYNRGSFEKERDAVMADLKFWYKEKGGNV